MLCSDGTATASSLAMNAVSAALMCSNIPWNGPLAAVQMACNESQQGTIVQPSVAELAGCSMSGIYVGTADSVLLADFQVGLLLTPPPLLPRTPCPPLSLIIGVHMAVLCKLQIENAQEPQCKAWCAKPILLLDGFETSLWQWLVLWGSELLHATPSRLLMVPAGSPIQSSSPELSSSSCSSCPARDHQGTAPASVTTHIHNNQPHCWL